MKKISKKQIKNVSDLRNVFLKNKNFLKFYTKKEMKNFSFKNNRRVFITPEKNFITFEGIGNKSIKVDDYFFKYSYLFEVLKNIHQDNFIKDLLSIVISDI